MLPRKCLLYFLTLLALALTVPWFPSDAVILGMPGWAFYSLAASLLYAILISFCLGKYWDLSASGDETEEGDSE